MTPVDDIRMMLRTAAAVFPYVSVWHDPHMFSWIINGSLQPHDPDLGVLQEKFSRPQVREDLASIRISDPFEFLAHFVSEGNRLAAFAGEGPLVVDDHTRLDFTVPRSEEANFGIANYNTNQWLVQLMEPGARNNVAFARFGRTVRRLAAYKESVFPYVVNAGSANGDPEEVRRKIDAAVAALPVH